jgi:hypothetical protein
MARGWFRSNSRRSASVVRGAIAPARMDGQKHDGQRRPAMKARRKIPGGAAALLLGAAASLPFAAQAQADGWQFRASIYGYFPSIEGASGFPSGGGGPTLDVDASEILDALKFTFMGTFEARKGRWGVFTDLIYLDVGDTQRGSRDFTVGGAAIPAGVTADLELDLKSWVWTVAGLYSLADTPYNSTDLLFGARMVDLTQTLDWSLSGSLGASGLPGRAGRSELSGTHWDAIVGLKGVATLDAGRRWVLPYYVDVGSGQSRLTWQALAGIGYSFDRATMTVAWRHLEYDFDSGKNLKDIRFSGPFFGLTFRW